MSEMRDIIEKRIAELTQKGKQLAERIGQQTHQLHQMEGATMALREVLSDLDKQQSQQKE